MCFLQEINNAFLRRRRKREWKVGVGWASERQNWADTAILWWTSIMQRDALQSAIHFSGRQTDSRPSICLSITLWIAICAAHLEQTPLILSVSGPLGKLHPTVIGLYENLWFFFFLIMLQELYRKTFKLLFKMLNVCIILFKYCHSRPV